MTQAVPRTVAGDRRAPSRGDQQRALIIDGVIELLGSVPIADLSVSQIAKHAGVTRPAFYFYFESKYAVVAAALERVWHELEGATSALDSFDFSEQPEEFSSRMIDDALAVWQANSALLNACVQSRGSDQQLAKMWEVFADSLVARLTSFVESIRRTGQIVPVNEDVPALVKALVTMTIAILLDQPGDISDMRLLAAAKAIWLASIWGRSSSDTSPAAHP